MDKIKGLVVSILNRAVSRYIRRNHITVIAVAGSIGKTSTTNAVRTVLSERFEVHKPQTAYNTNKSVHLELFDLPFATTTLGWAKMVSQVLLRSLGKAPYEVAVIEIGTDHPGELASFAWLKPDIGVLTAIAPEHMENFKTINAVAEEELSITAYCKSLLINTNTVELRFVPFEIAKDAGWYGKDTDYRTDHYRIDNNRVKADFILADDRLEATELQVLGVHSLDALTAAAAVAMRLGLSMDQIVNGLQAVQPVKGRMRRLAGIDGVTIIDDSYNASPEAVKAALDVLGQFAVPQRIAVLGMMNEMGDYSAQAHREVGRYCDPAVLDVVITIGDDANSFLAEAARERGCRVEPCTSPYAAGEYIRKIIKPQAAVLFKGSQNGVFAEEAIKFILADPADVSCLVRQSDYWMSRKRQQFKPNDS